MSNKKIALISLGALAAIAGLIVGLYFAVWHTSDPRGRLEARELTRGSGEFRLSAYNHFFTLCTAVQTQEDRIRNAQKELNAEPGPDARRTAILQQAILASSNSRAESIRQYNNDATRDYTSGQFRDNDLPYQLDINDQETQCAS